MKEESGSIEARILVTEARDYGALFYNQFQAIKMKTDADDSRPPACLPAACMPSASVKSGAMPVLCSHDGICRIFGLLLRVPT